MTAATRDLTSTSKVGSITGAELLSFPAEANTQIFGGTMVGTNAAGFAVPAGTAGVAVIWGQADQQVDNRNPPNGRLGAQGAQQVPVRKGTYFQNQDGSITESNVGQPCFAVDDNTVSLSSSGGTRIYAGIIQPGRKDGVPKPLTASDMIAVAIGLGNAHT